MAATDDRNEKIAIWVTSGFLALVFLATGVMKLVPGSPAGEAFETWGYPVWFRYFVGGCEVAGAIGLLVPRLAPFAAAGLVLLMGGATVTHLKTEGEARNAVVPVALVALLLGVAVARVRRARASANVE
jgi:uncharacterized membrane protein YphA (DoxX/SURF4 family)